MRIRVAVRRANAQPTSTDGHCRVVLDTLLNAAGVRRTDGAPVDDFGDACRGKGIIDDVVAKAKRLTARPRAGVPDAEVY